MQGLRRYTKPLTPPSSGGGGKGRSELAPLNQTALTIDVGETTERKIQRLVSENPVIIFSRSSSCCMCHVMRRLLSTLGVHPTVIELDEVEMGAVLSAAAAQDRKQVVEMSGNAPAVFVGGVWVGGLESLMGLHLSGNLVPKLREAGAL